MYTKNSSVGGHHARTLAYLATVGAAGLLLSCSSPSADKAAGSSTPEPAAPAATPESTPNVENSVPDPLAGEAPAQPSNELANSELDPANVAESTPPTLESTEAVRSLEERVTPVVSSVAGAKLLFIACDEQPCTLRAQSSTLTALHQVLTALSTEFSGNIAFEVREQLDAYTGHSFQADVLLDVAEGNRAVPSSQDDLLTPP